MAFIGHYEHSLDAKHRLSIPARFRAPFSDGVVLSKDADACIAIWRPEEHEGTVAQALAGKNPLSRDFKRVQRYHSSNSFAVELDSAGRVTLPQPLISHAGIDKEVVVAGVGTHVEVWERGAWHADQTALDGDIEEVTESLGDPS